MEQTIDLKAFILEREDCDAGTISRVKEGLSQGGSQFQVLNEINETLFKRYESAPATQSKKLALKLGITNYFLGYMKEAVRYFKEVDTPLGLFYLGKSLANCRNYEAAAAAFDNAEKAGYSAPQVLLMKASILRLQGQIEKAKAILGKLGELSAFSAEFHFQMASIAIEEGHKKQAIESLEKAVQIDPSHSQALFLLGFFNDQAGQDDEAIRYYEQCLKYPPVNKGVLYNLGILYEDNHQYDRAAKCFERLLKADYNDERARLFLKDAQASLDQTAVPEDEVFDSRFRQVLDLPITDFELSVRSRNCLKKMGLRTLGDLTRTSEMSLLSSKNFGETSLTEIRAVMNQNNLRIGQALEQGTQFEPTRPAPPVHRQHASLPPEQQAMMDRPVSELNLTVRARKCMNRLGISTIGELLSRTSDELLDAKNFGVTSLNEVKEKLTEMGLKLRGD
ncbi:MAG: DNA-directed RNA polymerase subunit alpha C-terminal domain-containing protein [Zavarzinella sp.]